MSRRVYEVTHRTAYGYEDEVTTSYGRAHLTPRDTAGQRCRSSRVEVSPEPDLLTERIDYFGNRCTYLEVHRPHSELVVTAVSRVEVCREPFDVSVLDRWTCREASALLRDERPVRATTERGVEGAERGVEDAERGVEGAERGVKDAERAVEALAAVEYTLPSALVPFDPALREYAAGVLPPRRPLGRALADLVHQVHADFAYVPGATSVTTSLAEVVTHRQGVCQDLAHVAVGCLRLAGLPARYVSGYLETRPPPGRRRLHGADASHAWLSVLVPQFGWVDLDPTNDQPADARYVVTAWGRDYADVPPLKGVIFTESSRSTLSVAVDVVRVDP